MIEKSIKPNSKVSYSISGHNGMQEFVFIPFYKNNAHFSISVSVGGKNYPLKNENSPTLYQYVKIDNIKTSDIIKITIHNQSNKFNSFNDVQFSKAQYPTSKTVLKSILTNAVLL